MTLDELQKEVTELKNRKEAVARENDDYTLRKIRSNLFFDDETKVQYLANQRFPNEDRPADRYFNQDGTLFYLDDNNILQREFPDNQVTGFLGANLYPNIVPAITFAADDSDNLFATASIQGTAAFGNSFVLTDADGDQFTFALSGAVGYVAPTGAGLTGSLVTADISGAQHLVTGSEVANALATAINNRPEFTAATGSDGYYNNSYIRRCSNRHYKPRIYNIFNSFSCNNNSRNRRNRIK